MYINKMNSTAKALWDCFKGEGKITVPILYDLFGRHNVIEKRRRYIIHGLYKGLYIMDTTWKEVYRCYLNNDLDKLIRTKYKIHPSTYYKEFCEKKIIIGNTYFKLSNKKFKGPGGKFYVDSEWGAVEWDDLSEEEKKKYEESKEEEDEDSKEEEDEDTPFIYRINPTYSYGPGIGLERINQDDEEKVIKKKIQDYKQQDKQKGRPINEDEYVKVDDVKKLLFKQENKCYVCNDVVYINDYTSKCCYQMTLDRIDESLPHTKTNLCVCCKFCNCRDFKNRSARLDGITDSPQWNYKLCPRGCHTMKRDDITRRRTDTQVQKEANILKLK